MFESTVLRVEVEDEALKYGYQQVIDDLAYAAPEAQWHHLAYIVERMTYEMVVVFHLPVSSLTWTVAKL